MVKIFIDDNPVEVKEGTMILSAAKNVGISIPHLCYHPAFAPEGSCRMCLVEIEGLPKLELACSTQAREGMKIWTQSKKIVEARKGVLEFLLAEHPLDCPICDKAGECKLQDYYEEYGLFEGQFKEIKEKKDKKVSIGKGLILDRERCILCTRCVRFLREITKTGDLGLFNRGLGSEISPYEANLINNNYSGNLAEICPVGAITQADFRFKIRTWFLERGDSICPLCGRGCNISIEYHQGFARFPRNKRVYRITARENPEVNGEWICDLGRYGYAYLDNKKLDTVILRNNVKEEELGWDKAIQFMVDLIKKSFYMKKTGRIALILNSWLTNEELFLIRKIFRDDLQMTKIFIVDPPQEEGDDFLLTPERSPNRRGAQELGFDLKQVDLEEVADKTEILLIFGPYLADKFDLGEIKASFDKVKTKLLFTPFRSGLESLVNVVFPTTHIAEKSGSLTNVDGIIQSFSPALEKEGESRPEWQILLDLAKELKINIQYYNQFTSPSMILQETGKEIPFFKKNND